MLKITLLSLVLCVGCASPENLATATSQAALTAPATPEASAKTPSAESPPTRTDHTLNCLNDTPEVKAKIRAEAEASKKRPPVVQVSGYRVPAALKSKSSFIDEGPRVPLPEVKMSESERIGRARYEEEYAKLAKKHEGGDRKKLRDEAWALKRKLVP